MHTLSQVDRRFDHGPFDIIGDVHGCYQELCLLLDELGYEQAHDDGIRRHPAGRKVVFLGDLVDRGPDVFAVLRLTMAMVEHGTALCVRGNHDDRLGRKLAGERVKSSRSLSVTMAQLEAIDPALRSMMLERVQTFLQELSGHYLLDGGRLVVAHAGLRENLQGGMSEEALDIAVHGELTGKIDEFGLHERASWFSAYRGEATVVYGHTPTRDPQWINKTLCIDTGCVYGGRLTALRYPDLQLVSVPALAAYARPGRPF